MAVQHALRPAGGAGRVAQRAGGVFVEFRPGIVLAGRRDQVVVAQQPHAGRQLQRRHPVGAGHHHDRLHGSGDRRGDGADHGVEAGLGEQHLVAGMIDDIADVVGVQARIDRVADRPHARRGIIDLQMSVAVHRQRADPVAGLDAQGLQRPHQPAGPALRVGPGVPVNVALDILGDDFRCPMVPRRMLQHGGDHQRLRLHQSEHGSPPSGSFPCGGAECAARLFRGEH